MNFDEIKQAIMNPEDYTDRFDAADIEKNKGLGIVACFPILFWIPLVADSNSQYCKFAANQGLILFILSVAEGVIGAILGLIPLIGGILATLINLVIGVAVIAAFVFLIYNASQGRAKPIPVIGPMIDIIK